MQKPPTTSLRFPNRLLDTVFDKETELDGILPEYCPDVMRLIRVDCTPYIDGCDVGSEQVHINGRVVYDILYETDRKNKLRYCSFTQDLTHTVELPGHSLEALRGNCSASCARITCKMLSTRRLLLHARLELHTVVSGENVLHLLSAEPTDGIFFRTKCVRYDLPEEQLRKEFRFEETLPLLQGEKNIGEVIFGTVSLQPPQVSVTGGSLSAKANAVVKVFYEAEDSSGGYCMTAKTVPLTLLLEDAAISDGKNCVVEAQVCESSVLPELDQYGESRLIKASFRVIACVTLVGSAEATVADDLFSVGYSDTVVTSEYAIPHLFGTADRSFTVDLKIQADQAGGLHFKTLYDTVVRAGAIHATPAEGGMELNGTLTVSVLGDSTDGVQHRDYTEPFVQFVPADLPEHFSGLRATVTPFEILPTLHADGSISARVICNARAQVYTEERTTFLSDLTRQAEPDKEEEPYAVAYFFPTLSDDLWSVAKRYRVDPERIRAKNPQAFDEAGRITGATKAILVLKD